MLVLIKKENEARPYHLIRHFNDNTVILWATYLIRKSAIHQAKKESERLKEELYNYIKGENNV